MARNIQPDEKDRNRRGKPITLAPMTVDEAPAALVPTAPPSADNGTRKGRMRDAQKRAVKRAKQKGR
jgi:hypothetical protein